MHALKDDAIGSVSLPTKNPVELDADLKARDRSLIAEIRGLEEAYGSSTICYYSPDRDGKPLTSDDAEALVRCFPSGKKLRRLIFMVNTNGGAISSAYRLATLLRHFCTELTVFPIHRARSAGTILCLAANEIALGPLSELSPIDPRFQTSAQQATQPGAISAEEIHILRRMAMEWFKLPSTHSGEKILNLAGQHIFPATLAAMYRAREYVLQIGTELLAFQQPRSSKQSRTRTIEALLSRYSDHSHTYSIAALQALGLRVRYRETEEEVKLQKLREMLAGYEKATVTPSPRAMKCILASNSCVCTYDSQLIQKKTGDKIEYMYTPPAWSYRDVEGDVS